MRTYNPDKWILIEIVTDDMTIRKVLGSWSGGYSDGDSWRINSGVSKTTMEGDYILFEGYSGSVYKCHKNMEGYNTPAYKILESMRKQCEDAGFEFRTVSFENIKEAIYDNT